MSMTGKQLSPARLRALRPTVKKLYDEGMTWAEILRVLGDNSPSLETLSSMIHGVDAADTPPITPRLKAEVGPNAVLGFVSRRWAAFDIGFSPSVLP
ncbi:TPA: hypothetical protein NJV69_002173 [Corynebacterium striatum]|uniref:hypothetical protein n=2 Tax=Corynebacterium striatum TaxID=43770 RepID=UPI001A2191D6|nr:hypothetical protein [Corynebacterium striatum]HAT6488031.1 hypothetical protein [Corynebacterium striatum]HCG3151235.1 hypothetical protein [Corynebacterium striatum]